jgi:hypothetical protein
LEIEKYVKAISNMVHINSTHITSPDKNFLDMDKKSKSIGNKGPGGEAAEAKFSITSLK